MDVLVISDFGFSVLDLQEQGWLYPVL